MQQVRDGLNPGNSISAPTLPPAYTMEASHIIDEIRDELSENETQPVEEDQYDELDENDDLGEGDSFSKGSSKKRKRSRLRNSESDEDKNFHRYNVLPQQQYVEDNVYNPTSYIDNSSGTMMSFNPMNSLTQIYSHPTAASSVVRSNYPQTTSSYLPFQPPSSVTSGVVLASTPTALSNPPMVQQQHQARKLPFTLRVLRFERIGLTEWDIKETRVFDIPQFIQSLLYLNSSSSSSSSGTSSSSSSLEMNLYLLNEKKLNKMLTDKKCTVSVSSGKGSGGGGIGMISLENELNQLQSILTHWPKYEIMQFQHFLSSYETSYLQYTSDNISNNNTGNSFTLFQYWNQLDESHSSAIDDQQGDIIVKEDQVKSGGSQSVIGYIAYEITVYLVLIIRKNLSLGIHNDIWCKIFPNELIIANEEIRQEKILKRNKLKNQTITKTAEGDNDDELVIIVTFGDILINFFPQLSYIIKKLRQQSHNNNNPDSTSNNTIPFEESDLLIKYYCINTLGNNSNTNNKNNSNSNSSNNSSNSNSVINKNRNNVNNGGGNGLKESNLVSDFTVPNMVSDNCYQTIGTFNTPANKVMAR